MMASKNAVLGDASLAFAGIPELRASVIDQDPVFKEITGCSLRKVDVTKVHS